MPVRATVRGLVRLGTLNSPCGFALDRTGVCFSTADLIFWPMSRISVTMSFRALTKNDSGGGSSAVAGHGGLARGGGSGLVGFGSKGGGVSVGLELQALCWLGLVQESRLEDGLWRRGVLWDLAVPMREGPGVGSLETLRSERAGVVARDAFTAGAIKRRRSDREDDAPYGLVNFMGGTMGSTSWSRYWD